MPSIVSRAKELEMRFLKYATRANQDKIKTVLEIYKDRKNVSYITAQNMIMALSSPSSQGGMEKVQKMYELLLNKLNIVDQSGPTKKDSDCDEVMLVSLQHSFCFK